MTDEQRFLEILKWLLQTSGGGALIWFGLKWFVKDYLEKLERIRTLEKSHTERIQGDIAGQISNLKTEIAVLKVKLDTVEDSFKRSANSLENYSSNLERVIKAFQGYVSNTEVRFQKMESQQSELVKLREDLVLIRQKFKKE